MTVAIIVVYTVCCLWLVFFVLLQKGEGGLGSTFGGQAVETALGAQSARTWRKVTAVLAALFMLLTIALVEVADHRFAASAADQPEAEQRTP